MNLYQYEHEAQSGGLTPVCGCDEAGAGPLAGRVYAAAVILPEDCDLPGLDDSKKLTSRQREALFPLIQAQAAAWSVAFVEAEEIDRTDILSARMRAMQLAMDALAVRPAFALVDGNRDKGKHFTITTPHCCVVGGDGLCASIAAASVLAKVSRDRYMVEMDGKYPGYGFAKHKGYGTRAHYAALDELGPCAIHRRTFLVKWKNRREQP